MNFGTWFRSRDARYTAFAASLALFFLLPALAQPSQLLYPSWSEFSDLRLIHWPKVLLLRHSLSQGQGWPLWSPYALSGQPLAANQLAMLFYPPALVLLVGPVTWSFTVFYALHLAWAAIGTYYFTRALGRSPESALLAAGIFVLNGKLVAHTVIGHLSLVAALAWLPWAMAFLHHTLEQHSTGFALLTGVALAAQLTTHTYALVYTAYGLFFYAALYLLLVPGDVRQRGLAALHVLPRLALVPWVAILLGAIQFLPLLEMADHSNRAFNFAQATRFSLSPLHTLTGLLLPSANVGHEWIIYPGLLTLALAALAWPLRSQRPVLILGLLSAAGVLLSLGEHTPFYHLVYILLPGVSWLRTPARLWFFVSLGLAVLAAHGLETWAELWRRPGRHRLRPILVAGAGFALLLGVGVMLTLNQRGRGTWGLAVFGPLSGLVLLWGLRHHRSLRHLAVLALLLLAADLVSFDYTLLRLTPREKLLAQGREAVEWLVSQPGIFRTYSPSYSLPQPVAAGAGLAQIDGVEPVHLADYDRFLALVGGYESASFSVTLPPFPEGVPLDEAHRDAVPNLRLLGLLDGRYVATAFPLDLPGLALVWQEGDTWIYENKQALSRAFVVHQVEPVAVGKGWQRLVSLDPARIALVEGGAGLDGTKQPTPAQVLEQSPNRLVIEAELDAPGFLVLAEIWYPGWQARDNGREVAIHRANAVLRGVYLDVGSHTVEFDYRPWSVRAGAIVSGITAVGLLCFAAIRRWRLS